MTGSRSMSITTKMLPQINKKQNGKAFFPGKSELVKHMFPFLLFYSRKASQSAFLFPNLLFYSPPPSHSAVLSSHFAVLSSQFAFKLSDNLLIINLLHSLYYYSMIYITENSLPAV